MVSLALRQWVDAGIILAIVLGSTLLGFYQEYRASAAVEELKRRLALTCRVVRDRYLNKLVAASAIVPGDVIVLSAGNLIPADGLVIEAEDFLVNEASLTGESFPVEKRPGTVPPETPVAGRTNSGLPRRFGHKAARRRSLRSRPDAGPRSARSSRGSRRARPRRSSGGASASSATF